MRLATAAQYRHIPKKIILSDATAYVSTADGISINIETSQALTFPTLSYTYFASPKIVIYFSNGLPLEITCEKMKYNHIFKDYVLEGNVLLIRGRQTLKTGFLRFDPKSSQVSSYDRYHFRSQGIFFRGQAFHVYLKDHLLTLYGIAADKMSFKKIYLSH